MEVNVFQSKKEKRITCIVFGIYMFLLCWLVLFKFATNIEEIPHMRGVNLIPFYSGTVQRSALQCTCICTGRLLSDSIWFREKSGFRCYWNNFT